MIDPPMPPESPLSLPAVPAPRQPVSALELLKRASARLEAKRAVAEATIPRPQPVSESQALLDECCDVADALKQLDCETLSPARRRASGIVAKWAIQKALEAAHQERGLPLPTERSLDVLARSVGLPTTIATEVLLQCISDDVTAAETQDNDPLPTHEDACRHARGVISGIIQDLALRRAS